MRNAECGLTIVGFAMVTTNADDVDALYVASSIYSTRTRCEGTIKNGCTHDSDQGLH